jgi:hypothetical protein
MKAKDLVILLQSIDPDAEIVTPGFDENGAASDFTLEPVGIIFNQRIGTIHFAPHGFTRRGEAGTVDGYLLDGFWR